MFIKQLLNASQAQVNYLADLTVATAWIMQDSQVSGTIDLWDSTGQQAAFTYLMALMLSSPNVTALYASNSGTRSIMMRGLMSSTGLDDDGNVTTTIFGFERSSNGGCLHRFNISGVLGDGLAIGPKPNPNPYP